MVATSCCSRSIFPRLVPRIHARAIPLFYCSWFRCLRFREVAMTGIACVSMSAFRGMTRRGTSCLCAAGQDEPGREEGPCANQCGREGAYRDAGARCAVRWRPTARSARWGHILRLRALHPHKPINFKQAYLAMGFPLHCARLGQRRMCPDGRCGLIRILIRLGMDRLSHIVVGDVLFGVLATSQKLRQRYGLRSPSSIHFLLRSALPC
ncbi:hypothetical protein K438DRAFT_837458 [Mycena galopus ATCC 62051]|nr:hypothetical protein K438DRAFT_837458 [Mycena galopus ATCC 62051]